MPLKKQRSVRSDKFLGETISLPLEPGKKQQIDEVRDPAESRSAFIRVAIDRELQRRGSDTSRAAE